LNKMRDDAIVRKRDLSIYPLIVQRICLPSEKDRNSQ
jgi:hypothetical protein